MVHMKARKVIFWYLLRYLSIVTVLAIAYAQVNHFTITAQNTSI